MKHKPETLNNINEIEIIDNEILGSDHCPIMITLNNEKIKYKATKQEVFVYENANWTLFKKTLESNKKIDNSLSIDNMYLNITENINKSVNLSIPKIKVFEGMKHPYPYHLRIKIKQKN